MPNDNATPSSDDTTNQNNDSVLNPPMADSTPATPNDTVVTQTPQINTPSATDAPPSTNTSPSEPLDLSSESVTPPPTSSGAARKTIATILGVVLLVAGVAAGVFLVNQNAEFRTSAWDCTAYVFEVSEDGVVTVRNGSTRNEPLQSATVSINDTVIATLDVPALNAGEAATLGSVPVPAGGFTWSVVGTKDCQDSGNYEVTVTPSEPPVTETPPSTTPTDAPISASCSAVIAYDTEWNQLNGTELAALTPGDVVRFVAYGTTDSGSFDAARFTVNGTLRSSVSTLRPGTTNEYYDEYIIPAGETTFTITAEVHHVELDNWY